jgi:hypothetical protein
MATPTIASRRHWRTLGGNAEENPLLALARTAEPWAHHRVAVPDLTRHALRVLTPLQLAWALVLTSIVTGATDCGGPLCAVVTLRKPVPLLVAAAVAVVLLVVIGILTRGFAGANRRETIGLTIAVAASVVSLLGVVAVLSLAAAVLAVVLAFLGALSDKPWDNR